MRKDYLRESDGRLLILYSAGDSVPSMPVPPTTNTLATEPGDVPARSELRWDPLLREWVT